MDNSLQLTPIIPESLYLVDCHYIMEQIAGCYILVRGERAIIIESNTQKAWPYLARALKELGIAHEAVDYVILSHLHLDHSGGSKTILDNCPNATLVCHPKGRAHLISPERLVQGSKALYGHERFDELYGTIEPVPGKRIQTMGHGHNLLWQGLRLEFIATQGHASHHISVLVRELGVIFTGDAFGVNYPGLSRPGQPFMMPATVPPEFDPVKAMAGFDAIAQSGAQQALLTHFGAVDIKEGYSELIKRSEGLSYFVTQELAGPGDEDRAKIHKRAFGFLRKGLEELLQQRNLAIPKNQQELMDMDLSMNAEGLAFYIQRQRKKQKFD